MIDRVHRELSDEDITRIASTYHAWRGDVRAGEYLRHPGVLQKRQIWKRYTSTEMS